MATTSVNSLKDFFKWIYGDLKGEAGKGKSKWTPSGADRRIYPDKGKYPGVFVRPEGYAFGPYSGLRTYLKECALTGQRRRTGPFTVEAHHLLEDRCMTYFGIGHSEGLCVGLTDLDHSVYSVELPQHLRRGRKGDPFMADIDVVYDAHQCMYKEHGVPEWMALIKEWLKGNKGRILQHYDSGKVKGATSEDIKRVKGFLAKL